MCGDISGAWNGDESGIAEDRANTADDIVELIEQIEELMKTL